MAGIYIPGMEIPKEHGVCVYILANGNVYSDGVILAGKAIPVSPRGDLIDRDGAVQDLRMDYAYAAARIVALQPTIIPADPQKKEET
jgi:hypothetical protein